MVQDLKKDEEVSPMDSPNWWGDLKKELEEGEAQLQTENQGSWWNDLKSELEAAK